MRIKWFISLLIFSNTLFLYAQNSEEQRLRDKEKFERDSQRANEQQQIDRVQKDNGRNGPEISYRAVTPNSAIRYEFPPTLTKEEKEKITTLRSASSADIARYSEFLKQKKTGIFKLFPDLGCEQGRIVRADGDCLNAVLNSWSYSFQKRDYGDGDLKLKDKSLISDSFLSQNIIVGLGDIPLETVSLGLDQAKFLLDFKPETKIKDAKEQFWQISKKITVNNFIYGKVIKTDENTTFLMRIIAYRVGNKGLFNLMNFDKYRRDKILAFRIIRKDTDNNITIVWKELADKKAPKLAFEKGEELTDLKEK